MGGFLEFVVEPPSYTLEVPIEKSRYLQYDITTENGSLLFQADEKATEPTLGIILVAFPVIRLTCKDAEFQIHPHAFAAYHLSEEAQTLLKLSEGNSTYLSPGDRIDVLTPQQTFSFTLNISVHSPHAQIELVESIVEVRSSIPKQCSPPTQSHPPTQRSSQPHGEIIEPTHTLPSVLSTPRASASAPYVQETPKTQRQFNGIFPLQDTNISQYSAQETQFKPELESQRPIGMLSSSQGQAFANRHSTTTITLASIVNSFPEQPVEQHQPNTDLATHSAPNQSESPKSTSTASKRLFHADEAKSTKTPALTPYATAPETTDIEISGSSHTDQSGAIATNHTSDDTESEPDSEPESNRLDPKISPSSYSGQQATSGGEKRKRDQKPPQKSYSGSRKKIKLPSPEEDSEESQDARVHKFPRNTMVVVNVPSPSKNTPLATLKQTDAKVSPPSSKAGSSHRSRSSAESDRSAHKSNGSPKLHRAPRVALSNVDITAMEQSLKFLRGQGGRVIEKLSSGFDILVIGHGEIKKTPKLLTAVAMGKPIVTDSWVTASARAESFQDTAAFEPNDPVRQQAWDFSFNDGKDRRALFKELRIVVTPTLKKEYGPGYQDIVELARKTGAKEVISKPAKSLQPDAEFIVISAEQDDIDALELLNRGTPCYNKDIISFSILRGVLDLESDEFKVSSAHPAKAVAPDVPPQRKRGRPRKSE